MEENGDLTSVVDNPLERGGGGGGGGGAGGCCCFWEDEAEVDLRLEPPIAPNGLADVEDEPMAPNGEEDD
jgi:hypothetical protein